MGLKPFSPGEYLICPLAKANGNGFQALLLILPSVLTDGLEGLKENGLQPHLKR